MKTGTIMDIIPDKGMPTEYIIIFSSEKGLDRTKPLRGAINIKLHPGTLIKYDEDNIYEVDGKTLIGDIIGEFK